MDIGIGSAVAGAAGAAGMGLFSYNRGNYMMDQKLHYSRYTAGLNMAIAQTKMYREDVTDLTTLTITRMDVYHGIAAMTATILTALYCPGRLGLHTPPPPGWLMGLFMVNLAGTYLWLGLTMWLAMHAALRADSAATHMLTRFVRLPVPGQWMLDRARKFLSSYEEQSLMEVFRIPFTRHQNRSSRAEGPYNEDMELDPDAERRTRHGYDLPAWYRKERAVDSGAAAESMLPKRMPVGARGSAPEHFEVLREIQNEWWPYDVYARLSIFLAFMHLAHTWTYMQIGHHLQETRSVFAVVCVVLPMFVLQQIILTLDIIPGKGEIPFQRVGPFAQWFALVAAVLEYKRWYSPGAQALGFVLVYVSYAIHIFYTLVLIRLCSPDMTKAPAPAEAPGCAWWPKDWQLPSAFQHAIWLVAPPKELEPGQADLAGEVRRAARGREGRPGLSVHRALGRQGESPAWFNVKVGLLAMVVAWLFLVLGFTVEVVNQGTAHPSLISAPGVPNNLRDPRYRPAKVGLHEPTEVGTGGAEAGPARGISEDAVERRLQAAAPLGEATAARREVAERLWELLPHLQELAGRPAAPVAPALAPAAAPVALQWPALFEPRLLACAPASLGARSSAALALARHGRGALLELTEGRSARALPFALEGLAALGPLVAAAWDEAGLLL
eukprot:CAMPEP_0168382718 /NCGR_PEP_ID=MMETSP0228-20121227/13537_1 /TAXON_ID=133427 /ORGANISM="Protoceratium reticulatum, Strain CCCM 535 (=CCMP 1889)" /LENGTH=667 /DNA_ID=CAMNT_0008395857 /DNA_START=84 /DNA_END=2084 /DNA_ORIENTATION=-